MIPFTFNLFIVLLILEFAGKVKEFLSTIFDINFVREVSTIIKILDFLIVPLVQITTSQPMRKFWMDIETQ